MGAAECPQFSIPIPGGIRDSRSAKAIYALLVEAQLIWDLEQK